MFRLVQHPTSSAQDESSHRYISVRFAAKAVRDEPEDRLWLLGVFLDALPRFVRRQRRLNRRSGGHRCRACSTHATLVSKNAQAYLAAKSAADGQTHLPPRRTLIVTRRALADRTHSTSPKTDGSSHHEQFDRRAATSVSRRIAALHLDTPEQTTYPFVAVIQESQKPAPVQFGKRIESHPVRSIRRLTSSSPEIVSSSRPQ